MFVIGIIPAFLLLYVRRWVDEPTIWVTTNRHRQEAQKRLETGSGSSEDRKLAQFTLTRILSDAEMRRRVGILLLMSITTVVGWWSAPPGFQSMPRAYAPMQEPNSNYRLPRLDSCSASARSRGFLRWVSWPTSSVASRRFGCTTWAPLYFHFATFFLFVSGVDTSRQQRRVGFSAPANSHG
jgi:hypothetical protein